MKTTIAIFTCFICLIFVLSQEQIIVTKRYIKKCFRKIDEGIPAVRIVIKDNKIIKINFDGKNFTDKTDFFTHLKNAPKTKIEKGVLLVEPDKLLPDPYSDFWSELFDFCKSSGINFYVHRCRAAIVFPKYALITENTNNAAPSITYISTEPKTKSKPGAIQKTGQKTQKNDLDVE